MAKKAKTPTEAAEVITMDENAVEVVEPLKTAYRQSYKAVRRAKANQIVYSEVGGEVCGVLGNGQKAAITGNYVDCDGERYFEIKGAKVSGFVKGLDLFW